MTMSPWDNQDIIDVYSDSYDDTAKNWFEDKLTIPALITEPQKINEAMPTPVIGEVDLLQPNIISHLNFCYY